MRGDEADTICAHIFRTRFLQAEREGSSGRFRNGQFGISEFLTCHVPHAVLAE
jgi:hypothetical protein